MFGLSLFCPSRQSNISTSGEERFNIPSPGRTGSVKCPNPGPTKTNKSPPLRPCWHWCAKGCNSSQQCWDLQCIVGRIQPIRLCKPCVMSVRGANNVGRAAQTDPTLLRYASAITQQKRSVRSCWLKSLTGFKLCATTHQRATGCANGRNM